jgi:hypothetical protein
MVEQDTMHCRAATFPHLFTPAVPYKGPLFSALTTRQPNSHFKRAALK